MQKLTIFFFVVLSSISITKAQQIQSPSEFLGYEIGTQFSRHHQVVDYFKHVESQMPNQVKMEKYGVTYFISTFLEVNMESFDEIVKKLDKST